jgi:hypothetical protein
VSEVFCISLNNSLWNLVERGVLVPVFDIFESMSNLTILRGWIKELKLTDIAQSFFSGPSQEKLTRLSAD